MQRTKKGMKQNWHQANDIITLYPVPKKEEREVLRSITLNALRLVSIPKTTSVNKGVETQTASVMPPTRETRKREREDNTFLGQLTKCG